MFCTKCGVELTDRDKFCSQCGTAAAGTFPPGRSGSQRLSRPTHEGKIAGVCAGFARYFGVDVTLMRIIWVAITIWPVPVFGLIAYIAAWIIMPKDPLALPAATTAMEPMNGGAH
jgi:phage shock protein C